jgi:CheY-like chemotaxis protein
MAKSKKITDKIPIFKDIRVLVVDDDEDSRDIVCAILEHGGAEVTCAGAASEALMAFVGANAVFDVVISDLAMPNRDGVWLVRQLKREAHEQGRSLWAVALTAHAEQTVRADALAAGFDRYLTKPFAFEDLANAVILRGEVPPD